MYLKDHYFTKLAHLLQVDSSWSQGDTQRANANSIAAKRWNIISIVSGVVLGVLAVVFFGATRFIYYY